MFDGWCFPDIYHSGFFLNKFPHTFGCGRAEICLRAMKWYLIQWRISILLLKPWDSYSVFRAERNAEGDGGLPAPPSLLLLQLTILHLPIHESCLPGAKRTNVRFPHIHIWISTMARYQIIFRPILVATVAHLNIF